LPAEPKRLDWTREPPTKPGYYWIRHHIAGQPVHQVVRRDAHWFTFIGGGRRRGGDMREYDIWPEPIPWPAGNAS
jgi:hypothetical protein